ncbi:CBS domain-containing protein [Zooshikella harenae]|uniref:CBS domain-containing protein n=1 Tax=Zooshikella harenae TaxID=2827238 RepID=A0ABS5ZDK7_9GAMM|nr:CBS domain-containing protein [Zooshikella harenae]MBU2712149.1 CBS domain-containing protein [Zooshikella harenae]
MPYKTISDIMIRDVISCTEKDSLDVPNRLMAEHSIRHIPVISSENGDFLGVITQKHLLKEAFQQAKLFGSVDMWTFGRGVTVKSAYSKDVETVQPELPLSEAGKYFLETKYGCLPVVEQGKLIGLVTSVDFVRIAVELLTEQEKEDKK